MEVASLAGSLYQLTLVDDATNKMFTYFFKSKSEVSEAFIDFKDEVKNQTGLTIKRFRSDNGTEFVNEKMKSLFKKCGIIHQRSVAYTPQQNGKAERANRTIVERARSMLADAGLPKTFWAEAANTAVYLINRSPTKSQEVTPEEAWSNVKPDLFHLRIFGSDIEFMTPKQKRKKWDHKSCKSGIFIGYPEHTKGYRVYDMESKQVEKTKMSSSRMKVNFPQKGSCQL